MNSLQPGVRRVISCTEQQIKCFIWITEQQGHLCTRIIEIQCKHRRADAPLSAKCGGHWRRGGSRSQPSSHAPFLAGATQPNQSHAATALSGPTARRAQVRRRFVAPLLLLGQDRSAAETLLRTSPRSSSGGGAGDGDGDGNGDADSQPLVNWFSP